MEIPSQKSAEVLKILRSVVDLCKYDSGNLSCHIYRDLEKENVIMIEEMWRSQEDLERHLRSEEYRNLLLVVELALECPEIKFNTISSSTGIETIEQTRSHAR